MKFVFLFRGFQKPLNPSTNKHISPAALLLRSQIGSSFEWLFLSIYQGFSTFIWLSRLMDVGCHILLQKRERRKWNPTLSLVPTPSVPDTRIGSTKPAAFRSNSPAKPPSSALHPDEKINTQLHLYLSFLIWLFVLKLLNLSQQACKQASLFPNEKTVSLNCLK